MEPTDGTASNAVNPRPGGRGLNRMSDRVRHVPRACLGTDLEPASLIRQGIIFREQRLNCPQAKVWAENEKDPASLKLWRDRERGHRQA